MSFADLPERPLSRASAPRAPCHVLRGVEDVVEIVAPAGEFIALQAGHRHRRHRHVGSVGSMFDRGEMAQSLKLEDNARVREVGRWRGAPPPGGNSA